MAYSANRLICSIGVLCELCKRRLASKQLFSFKAARNPAKIAGTVKISQISVSSLCTIVHTILPPTANCQRTFLVQCFVACFQSSGFTCCAVGRCFGALLFRPGGILFAWVSDVTTRVCLREITGGNCVHLPSYHNVTVIMSNLVVLRPQQTTTITGSRVSSPGTLFVPVVVRTSCSRTVIYMSAVPAIMYE